MNILILRIPKQENASIFKNLAYTLYTSSVVLYIFNK